jgi:hypothetical protein
MSFREIAAKTLSMSDLMDGREKITTEQLIGQTVTVTEFDFATITDRGEEKTFPVLIFKEFPNNYYCGGTLLAKMCMAWAAEYDGDVASASNALADEGGVQIRFTAGKTKSGNNLTNITVL